MQSFLYVVTTANNIAIVFHSNTMMTLLKTWCNVNYDSGYYFFYGK